MVAPTELVSVIAPARVSTTLPTGTEPPAVSGTKPAPGALTRTVPRVGATTTDSPCTGSAVVGVRTVGAGVPGSVGAGVGPAAAGGAGVTGAVPVVAERLVRADGGALRVRGAQPDVVDGARRQAGRRVVHEGTLVALDDDSGADVMP